MSEQLIPGHSTVEHPISEILKSDKINGSLNYEKKIVLKPGINILSNCIKGMKISEKRRKIRLEAGEYIENQDIYIPNGLSIYVHGKGNCKFLMKDNTRIQIGNFFNYKLVKGRMEYTTIDNKLKLIEPFSSSVKFDCISVNEYFYYNNEIYTILDINPKLNELYIDHPIFFEAIDGVNKITELYIYSLNNSKIRIDNLTLIADSLIKEKKDGKKRNIALQINNSKRVGLSNISIKGFEYGIDISNSIVKLNKLKLHENKYNIYGNNIIQLKMNGCRIYNSDIGIYFKSILNNSIFIKKSKIVLKYKSDFI